MVGNAANHVYALHGSGVGMGLVAARLLADAVTARGDSRDAGNAEVLHRYAHRFLQTYGGRLAILESAATSLLRRQRGSRT